MKLSGTSDEEEKIGIEKQFSGNAIKEFVGIDETFMMSYFFVDRTPSEKGSRTTKLALEGRKRDRKAWVRACMLAVARWLRKKESQAGVI